MGLKPVVGDHWIGFSPDDWNLRNDLLPIICMMYYNIQQLSLSVGVDKGVCSQCPRQWRTRPFPFFDPGVATHSLVLGGSSCV